MSKNINSTILASEVPRVSFQAQSEFQQWQSDLRQTSDTSGFAKRPPPCRKEKRKIEKPEGFVTKFSLPSRLDLLMEASKSTCEATTNTYAPAHAHHFRDETPSSWVHEATFRTKFFLPNNQILRKRVAQNQEGFLASTSNVPVGSSRAFLPLRKPDFVLTLPNTTSKAGNLNARLAATVDQAGFFQGGQTITEHVFRNEQPESWSNSDFELNFKPSGKGIHALDIGTRERPTVLGE